MSTRADSDVVEVDPVEDTHWPRGRVFAIIAGICAVLLAIAVTNNALRDDDGSGPDEQQWTPPDEYFSADRLNDLTAIPIERQAGRPLHYLNLGNDGTVTFGLCQGDGTLMHFTVDAASVEQTDPTTEPCFGGFEFTESLKALVRDLAARSGYKKVDVAIDSGNRLTPIITVTRDRQPAEYGIDGIRRGPTQINLANPDRRAEAIKRISAVGGPRIVHRVCAWFDLNQLSVDLADPDSGRIDSWIYVGTPVQAATTYTPGLGPLGAAEPDLDSFMTPPSAVALALGGAILTGVCSVGAQAPYGVPTVEYYTASAIDYPIPGAPQSLRGLPIIAGIDGTVLR